jgi:hypothetical protein
VGCSHNVMTSGNVPVSLERPQPKGGNAHTR